MHAFTSENDGRASVHAMSARQGRTSPGFVSRYVLHLIRERLRSGAVNQAQIAVELGLSKGQITLLLQKNRGVGKSTEDGMARLLGIDLPELYRRAADWERENPPPPEETTIEREEPATMWGELEGWAGAETEARRRKPLVPEEAWLGARRVVGASEPAEITWETVYRTAMFWLDTHARPTAPLPPEDPDTEARKKAAKALKKKQK